jgi:hypothetical protein
MPESRSAPCPQSEAESRCPRHRRPNRTQEDQRAERFRAELISHLAGDPSTTQLALVDRLAAQSSVSNAHGLIRQQESIDRMPGGPDDLATSTAGVPVGLDRDRRPSFL